MFTLKYELDPTGAQKAKHVDMAAADATALRYRLFPGDVVFRNDDVDFSTQWRWVQVLDFALSLEAIDAALDADREARFEFTESDAALDFRLEVNDVVVSSTYAPGLLRVEASEFHAATKRFAQLVIHELCEQHPGLAENPAIRSIRDGLQAPLTE